MTYAEVDEKLEEDYEENYGEEASRGERSEDIVDEEDSNMLDMEARERAMKIVGRPKVQAMWSPEEDSEADALFQESVAGEETPPKNIQRPAKRQDRKESSHYASKFMKPTGSAAHGKTSDGRYSNYRTQKSTPGDAGGKLSLGRGGVLKGTTESAQRKKPTSTQKSRMKGTGLGQMSGLPKLSSFDFTQSALQ